MRKKLNTLVLTSILLGGMILGVTSCTNNSAENQDQTKPDPDKPNPDPGTDPDKPNPEPDPDPDPDKPNPEPDPDPTPVERPAPETFDILVEPSAEMNFTEATASIYLFKAGTEDKNAAWPGEQMTLTSTENLYGYKLENVAAYSHVIFNASGKQTVDIPLANYSADYRVFKVTGTSADKFTGEWQNFNGEKQPEAPVPVAKANIITSATYEGFPDVKITDNPAKTFGPAVENGIALTLGTPYEMEVGRQLAVFAGADATVENTDVKVGDLKVIGDQAFGGWFNFNIDAEGSYTVTITKKEVVPPTPVERPEAATFDILVKPSANIGFTEETASIYLFKDGTEDKNAAWPGQQLVLTKTENLYGFKIADLSIYTHVIFNANGKQTVDIPLANFSADYKVFAINADANADGKFEGHWENLAGELQPVEPTPDPDPTPVTKTLYFQAKLPWAGSEPQTRLFLMNDNNEVINAEGTVWDKNMDTILDYSLPMKWLAWKDSTNTWTYEWDVSSTITKIAFGRFSGANAFWYSFTETVAVPDFETANGYFAFGETPHYDFNDPTKQELTTIVPYTYGTIPEKPVLPDEPKEVGKIKILAGGNWSDTAVAEDQTARIIFYNENNEIVAEDGTVWNKDMATLPSYFTEFANWFGQESSLRFVYTVKDNLKATKFSIARFHSDGTRYYDVLSEPQLIPDFTKINTFKLAQNPLPTYDFANVDAQTYATVEAFLTDDAWNRIEAPKPVEKEDATAFDILVKPTAEMGFTEETASIYFYKDGTETNNAAWPGEKMSLTKTDGLYGFKIADLTPYSHVIFNADGKQTVNISLADYTIDYKVFAIDKADDTGKFIGHWENLVGEAKPVEPTPDPEPVEKEEATAFDILVKPTAEMSLTEENAYIYLFKDGTEDKNANWPGEKLSLTKTDGLYGFKIADLTPYTHVIFNAGDGKAQTVNIALADRTVDYKVFAIDAADQSGKFTGHWENLAGEAKPVEPTPEPEVPVERPEPTTFNTLFRPLDTVGFEFNAPVYAYLFKAPTAEGEAVVENAKWPGVQMTLTSTDRCYGMNLTAEDLAKYDTIIFNNGTDKQTINLALVERSETANCFTISGVDEAGKFLGNWNAFDTKPVEPTPDPETPVEPTKQRTFYVGMPKWYKDANAIIKAYSYVGADAEPVEITWKELKLEGNNYILEITVPANVTEIEFKRFNPADNSIWNNPKRIVFANFEATVNLYYLGDDNNIYPGTYTPAK